MTYSVLNYCNKNKWNIHATGFIYISYIGRIYILIFVNVTLQLIQKKITTFNLAIVHNFITKVHQIPN